jgi:hypothetical protein
MATHLHRRDPGSSAITPRANVSKNQATRRQAPGRQLPNFIAFVLCPAQFVVGGPMQALKNCFFKRKTGVVRFRKLGAPTVTTLALNQSRQTVSTIGPLPATAEFFSKVPCFANAKMRQETLKNSLDPGPGDPGLGTWD